MRININNNILTLFVNKRRHANDTTAISATRSTKHEEVSKVDLINAISRPGIFVRFLVRSPERSPGA